MVALFKCPWLSEATQVFVLPEVLFTYSAIVTSALFGARA